MEIQWGTVQLKKLIQKFLLQGNARSSGGAGAATEKGAYLANSFDGLRLMTSGTAPYNSPGSASVIDQDSTLLGGPFTIGQAVNMAAATAANVGASPSLIVLSAIANAKLMSENEGKQRTESTELIAGVQVPAISTTVGQLPVLWVPGASAALGQYNRTGDSVSVEDAYVLDESMLTLRWLWNSDINVLEIPAGVDGQLSRRYILFAFYGLECADNGFFQAKVRLPV